MLKAESVAVRRRRAQFHFPTRGEGEKGKPYFEKMINAVAEKLCFGSSKWESISSFLSVRKESI